MKADEKLIVVPNVQVSDTTSDAHKKLLPLPKNFQKLTAF